MKSLSSVISVPVAGFVAVLLLWARAPDAFSSPQFFAEDLAVFWSQWRDLGLASIWTPYGGYLHVAPRLGAAAASWLPFKLQPTAYLAVSVMVTGWTAMTIASARLPRGLGFALAMALSLVPHDGEIWASLVNMQWIMACALPLIAMTETPRTPAARMNFLAFTAVASGTGPFSALAIPLWIFRGIAAFKARDRYGLMLVAIGVIGGITQAAFIASAGAPHETPTASRPLSLALAFVGRFGLDYLSILGSSLGVVLLICLVLSPIVREGRTIRLSFLIFALLLMIPTYLKFYRMPELIISRSVAGRYFYVPSLMLLWVAVSSIWLRRPLPIAIGTVSTALIIAATTLHFARSPRTFYPDWRENSEKIGKQAVTIRYAPDWLITIPPDPR